jgi:DNA-directed RNA polymerase specialized sigma24 family protein
MSRWDECVTRAAVTGDDADAWAVVVNGTHRFLLAIVAKEGASWDEAEEIVQLTQVRAWERRHQFARGGTFADDDLRNWLARIAINAWRDERRHQSRSTRITNHCDLSQAQALRYISEPSRDLPPEEDAVRCEELTAAQTDLARLVGRMKPTHAERVPLLLEAEMDRSLRSGQAMIRIPRVMAVTGLGRAAAKSAIHRAKAALKHEAMMDRLEQTS